MLHLAKKFTWKTWISAKDLWKNVDFDKGLLRNVKFWQRFTEKNTDFDKGLLEEKMQNFDKGLLGKKCRISTKDQWIKCGFYQKSLKEYRILYKRSLKWKKWRFRQRTAEKTRHSAKDHRECAIFGKELQEKKEHSTKDYQKTNFDKRSWENEFRQRKNENFVSASLKKTLFSAKEHVKSAMLHGNFVTASWKYRDFWKKNDIWQRILEEEWNLAKDPEKSVTFGKELHK